MFQPQSRLRTKYQGVIVNFIKLQRRFVLTDDHTDCNDRTKAGRALKTELLPSGRKEWIRSGDGRV